MGKLRDVVVEQNAEDQKEFLDGLHRNKARGVILSAINDLQREYALDVAMTDGPQKLDMGSYYAHLEFLEPEFLDFLKILQFGATKYARNNWLLPEGGRSSHKEMHDSMFHHLAESYSGKMYDEDTGNHPLLHLAARALMVYTRFQRGIIHPDDNKE